MLVCVKILERIDARQLTAHTQGGNSGRMAWGVGFLKHEWFCFSD